MLLIVPGVLKPDELALVRALLAAARFVDGRLSAGAAARRVKSNEELEPAARARRIADFIAGMTDRFALVEHARLFDSTPELR